MIRITSVLALCFPLACSAGDPMGKPVISPQVDDLIASQTDTDLDDVSNLTDNCISLFNPGQEDRDGDEVGDICDLCPDTPAFGETYGCPYVEGTPPPADKVADLKQRILAEQQGPPCEVAITAGLDDASWTRASGTRATMWVEARNLTKSQVVMSWQDNCPCGHLPGQGVLQAIGLPPRDGESAFCEDASNARLQQCANMGMCNPERPLPSLVLEPGERKRLPFTMPLDPAGLGCAYGALPVSAPLTIYPNLLVTKGHQKANPGPRLHERTEQPATRPFICPLTPPLVVP